MTHSLFTYFLNSLWQVPLLALCAWLALRVTRSTPRAQHLLWIATLLFAVLLPLRGAGPAAAPATIDISTLDYDGPLSPLPVTHTFLPRFDFTVAPRTAAFFAAIYLALTALCLIRLVLAQLAVRRLLAASTPGPEHPEYRLRTLPPTHHTPLVAGIFRPVILLPASLGNLSPDHLAAVLAHESAHIRRRDLLTNLALRVASLPIAWHPATLYLHQQVRRTRELLVDALAARTLASPGAYASSLLALAGHLMRPHSPLTAALFDHQLQPRTSQKILEERIMHLIAPPAPPRPVTRAFRIGAGGAILLTATLAASLIHLTPSVLAAPQSPAPVPPASVAQPAPVAEPAPLPPQLSSQPTPPLPALTPATPSAAPDPFTPQQREQLEERIRIATEQLQKTTAQIDAQIDTPAFRKQMAEAARNPIDPATQQRINQLSRQIAQSQVNSPEFRRSMEELKRQLNSPEFKQHLRELTERANQAALSAESQRKLSEDLKRQLDSPEFRQQLAQLRADSLKLSAESRRLRADTLALNPLSPAQAQAPLAPLPSVPPTASLPAPPAALAPVAPSPDGPVRISGGIMAGQRESGKNPTYPPDAKAAHITGSVVLHAIISRDGTIESLQTVSGPQELQQAAWDAVKTWVYKPYLLNGQPTAVETTITVNFSLTQ